jgi:hypothetical protein
MVSKGTLFYKQKKETKNMIFLLSFFISGIVCKFAVISGFDNA